MQFGTLDQILRSAWRIGLSRGALSGNAPATSRFSFILAARRSSFTDANGTVILPAAGERASWHLAYPANSGSI